MTTDPLMGDALLAGAIILAGGAIGAESATGWPDRNSSPGWPGSRRHNHGCSPRSSSRLA
jgi:hypothetical protein